LKVGTKRSVVEPLHTYQPMKEFLGFVAQAQSRSLFFTLLSHMRMAFQTHLTGTTQRLVHHHSWISSKSTSVRLSIFFQSSNVTTRDTPPETFSYRPFSASTVYPTMHAGASAPVPLPTAQHDGASEPFTKRRKLLGREFYESIGSPRTVVAPMVEQSELVRKP
jgi:hypothetical protein